MTQDTAQASPPVRRPPAPAPYRPGHFLPEPPQARRYYTVLSVDDHLVEPPHMFEGRMPARLRDRAPRVVENADGSQSWLWEDRAYPQIAICAVVGRPKDRWGWEATRFEDTRRGCYDPVERIRDMDLDGVQASLNFPSFMPGLGGHNFWMGTQDPELGLACVRAWNDWFFEDWYSAYPDRIIPCGITWLGDPQIAAAEVRRNAARGFRALSFVGTPSQIGLPDLRGDYWDPLLRACEETDTVICLHVGSDDWNASPPGASVDVGAICFPLSAYRSAADWLWSGALVRFPRLKIAMSEGGLAWVPMLMDRVSYVMEHSAATNIDRWSSRSVHPIEVLKNNFYYCAIEFGSGMDMHERIGIDHIMVESDYPHADSSWPNTQEGLRAALAGFTPEQIRKITWENASKLFRFDVSQAALQLAQPLPA